MSAPRSLKDAVNCRFSNFRWMSAASAAESVTDFISGVRTTASPSRSRAARMLASVTAKALRADALTTPYPAGGRARCCVSFKLRTLRSPVEAQRKRLMLA